jgi:hypothetical protein
MAMLRGAVVPGERLVESVRRSEHRMAARTPP